MNILPIKPIRPDPLPFSSGALSFEQFSPKYFSQFQDISLAHFSQTDISTYSSINSIYEDSLSEDISKLPNFIEDNINKTYSSLSSKYIDNAPAQKSPSNHENQFSKFSIHPTSASRNDHKQPSRVKSEYLTETSADNFHKYLLYNEYKWSTNLPNFPNISTSQPIPFDLIIGYALFALIGLDSNVCYFNKNQYKLEPLPNLVFVGLSKTVLNSIFTKFSQSGTCFARLLAFSSFLKLGSYGAVGEALSYSLEIVLRKYHFNVVMLETPSVKIKFKSILSLLTYFHPLIKYIKSLALIFKCFPFIGQTKWDPSLVSLPKNASLLTYIQEKINGINPTQPIYRILCYLLTKSYRPLLFFLQNWIFHGEVIDPGSDFGLQTNSAALKSNSEQFWTTGFCFRSHLQTMLPLPQQLIDEILICGKSLRLLAMCEPSHHLLTEVNSELHKINTYVDSFEIKKYLDYWECYGTRVLEQLKFEREEKQRRESKLEDLKFELVNKDWERKEKEYLKKKHEEIKLKEEKKKIYLSELQQQINEKRLQKITEVEKERQIERELQLQSIQTFPPIISVANRNLIDQIKKERIEHYAKLGVEIGKEIIDSLNVSKDQLNSVDLIPDPYNEKADKDYESTNLELYNSLANDQISEITDQIKAGDESESDFQVNNKFGIEINSLNPEVMNDDSKIQVDSHSTPICDSLLLTSESTEILDRNDSIQNNNTLNFSLNLSLCDSNRIYSLQVEGLNTDIKFTNDIHQDPDKSRLEDALGTQLPATELIKTSFYCPILIQSSLVNTALLDYYFNTLCINSHFQALKKFLLLDHGEFAQYLSMQIFDILYPTPQSQYWFLTLNSILGSALNESRSSNISESQNLLLVYNEPTPPHKVETSQSASISEELAHIELRYKIDWPINIVLRKFVLNDCYSKIFNYLLFVRRCLWHLCAITQILKSLQDALNTDCASAHGQIKSLHICRNSMQHFITVLRNYLDNQVIKASWKIFQKRLKTVKNLEDLYREHKMYISLILVNTALSKRYRAIQSVFRKIFYLILKFYKILSNSKWNEEKSGLDSYSTLMDVYNNYQKLTNFLCNLIKKIVMNGYVTQLEHFLLMINYNTNFTLGES